MKQHCLFVIILSIIISAKALGQENRIIFEQKALDYFADSILNKVNPFKNLVAHFDGTVDSGITTIEFEMTMKYPDDKELMEEYRKREMATNEFWKKNIQPSFQLIVKDPIKNKSKKHYGNKSKVIRLMVFQTKTVGIRNFVWIRTFIKHGSQGFDMYYVFDNNGKIINWYYGAFIF